MLEKKGKLPMQDRTLKERRKTKKEKFRRRLKVKNQHPLSHQQHLQFSLKESMPVLGN